MTEVCFCEGGHRTRLEQFNLCVFGCPLPPYIKEQGGGRPALPMVRLGCNPTRNRIAILFLVGTTKKRKRGKGKEGEVAPPNPSPTRNPRWGAGQPLWAA